MNPESQSRPNGAERQGIGWKKVLLIAGGIIALALGTVGVFVPLLPTTPFLLLAAAAFIRSSPRLYDWLIQHRLFGRLIRDYREFHGMSRRHKIVTLVLLWGVIGYSVVAVAAVWWLRGLLLAIAAGVTWHILALATVTDEMRQAQSDACHCACGVSGKGRAARPPAT